MTEESINTAGLTEEQCMYVEFWHPLLEEMNQEHGWSVDTFNKRWYS